MAAPPSVVDVSLGPRAKRNLWGVTIGFLLFGVLLVGSAVLGDDVPIPVLIIGVVLLLIGVGLARLTPKALRHREVVVDQDGIRLVDTGWRPFEVRWEELAQVRASYARKPGPARNPVSWGGITEDAGPEGELRRSFGVSTFVRLDLVPADPAFLERHPNMKPYRRFTGRPEGVGPDPAPWAPDVGDRQAVR